MKGFNKWIVAGNLGKDPELRYTNTGTAVANFSIAINSAWKDQDGNAHENVEWVNVVCWKKLAEIVAEYLKKGAAVLVEGRAQTRSWDDKDTGKKRYSTELVAENLIMLGSKQEVPDRAEPGTEAPPVKDPKDDDLPF